VDSTPPAVGSLQPRYRRLFTFGDVLDESVRLYRAHWVAFALVSAVSLLPPGLVLVAYSAAGQFGTSFSLAEIETGRFSNLDLINRQAGALFVAAIVSGLFSIAWTAAVVATTDAFLRGQEPALKRVYGRALRGFVRILLASLVFFLALCALTVAAAALFIITVFGIVGGLAAIIGLLFWWLRPTSRKTWLKWLIILATPFGLPTYYSLRWSMYVPAIVLEDYGPIACLRRSGELTDRHWFRVGAILTVASLIVGILLSVLASLIDIPMTIYEATRGQFGLSPTETAISNAITVIVRILFASIGAIVYTILFVDLRNRREGTDIGERLSQLEAAPSTTYG
jgi:hypothetical protein